MQDTSFHPMKGPMTTQSLRGMANHGPMHWRGDRTGGNDAPSAQPDSGTFDEGAAFKKFQAGVHGPAGDAARSFRPPNAGVHRLHPAGHVSAEPDPEPRQLAHARRSRQDVSSSTASLRHSAADASAAENCLPGLLGVTDRSERQSADGEARVFRHHGRTPPSVSNPQVFKMPHLRNVYQKVGMFGNRPYSRVLSERHQPPGRSGARVRAPA